MSNSNFVLISDALWFAVAGNVRCDRLARLAIIRCARLGPEMS